MVIFCVNDVQGYQITLSQERWDHILEGHPEVKELQDILQETVRSPQLIMCDPERKEVFYYYRLTGRSLFRKSDIYMSAVIERNEANKVGYIKTAHLVRKPRNAGEMVWFQPQTR